MLERESTHEVVKFPIVGFEHADEGVEAEEEADGERDDRLEDACAAEHLET